MYMKIEWGLGLVLCIFLSIQAMEESKEKKRAQYIIEREMSLYDSFYKAAEQETNQQKEELKIKRAKSLEMPVNLPTLHNNILKHAQTGHGYP